MPVGEQVEGIATLILSIKVVLSVAVASNTIAVSRTRGGTSRLRSRGDTTRTRGSALTRGLGSVVSRVGGARRRLDTGRARVSATRRRLMRTGISRSSRCGDVGGEVGFVCRNNGARFLRVLVSDDGVNSLLGGTRCMSGLSSCSESVLITFRRAIGIMRRGRTGLGRRCRGLGALRADLIDRRARTRALVDDGRTRVTRVRGRVASGTGLLTSLGTGTRTTGHLRRRRTTTTTTTTTTTGGGGDKDDDGKDDDSEPTSDKGMIDKDKCFARPYPKVACRSDCFNRIHSFSSEPRGKGSCTTPAKAPACTTTTKAIVATN